VVVCAAGSAPGDLHKLWHARDPAGKGYHVEYGYSCMGYEIPGGMGVKLAAPEREVFVFVGDGSYLMLPASSSTAVAERIPIVVVLVDNHGYASIGALSRSVGSAGFGTHYRRAPNGACRSTPPTATRSRAGDALPGRPRGQRREPRRARDPARARSPSCAGAAPTRGRRRAGRVTSSPTATRRAQLRGWWDVPWPRCPTRPRRSAREATRARRAAAHLPGRP
jgi:3D-(3,5/4)-trihydroxycyclohexane-1,2-dione acylhydrolase (decyclizing)